MPKGPVLMRWCTFCRQPAGKQRDSQYTHAREAHGAKALTKAKALELYPHARTPSNLNDYMDRETVWVFEEKGVVTIYAEDDLFKIELPPEPPPTTLVPAPQPFKPPDRIPRAPEAAPVQLVDPPLGRVHNMGFNAAQKRLAYAREMLQKADAMLKEIQEGT